MLKQNPRNSLSTAQKYVDAGYYLTRLNGKTAIDKNWQNPDLIWSDDLPNFIESCPNGNFGIVLSALDLVIDVDPRNFDKGDKPLERLLKDINVSKEGLRSLAAMVRTGGKGMHLYLRMPREINIHKQLKAYRGIDFLTKGQYVAAASCIHPDTKQNYTLSTATGDKRFRTLKEVKEAPPALLALIAKAPAAKQTTSTTAGDSDNNKQIILKYVDFLIQTDEAIEGHSGDDTTYKVACRGRDLGFSCDKTYELMIEHYNPRCVPPWSAEELKRKVENAYEYATGAEGIDLPENEFDIIQSKDHLEYRGWDFSKPGVLKTTLNNCVNFFLMREELRGVVAYDEFAGQVIVQKNLPWRKRHASLDQWSDNDTIGLRLFLSRNEKFDTTTSNLDQAVIAYAKSRSFHPLKDYLSKLEWDGVDRLETWMVEYCEVANTRVNRAISKLMIMQAVKRALYPGCKADYIVVMESGQGKNKSQMLKALGDPWYADINLDAHSKDTIDAMRGKWIIELAEMEVSRKNEANALKAFITRETDRVRLAYGRITQDIPRTCVFCGTVNPDAINQYLIDPTGNRRFLPLRVGNINVIGVRDIKHQLFAEAVVRLGRGEPSYIKSDEINEELEVLQTSRSAPEAWELSVIEYIKKLEDPYQVTTRDVWVYGLHGSEIQLNRAYQLRIANVLKKLGYVSSTTKVEGVSTRVFVNPAVKLTDFDDKISCFLD